MPRFRFHLAVLLLAAPATPLPAATDPAAIQRFVATYCVECHGPGKQKADRRFDTLQLPATKEDTLLALKEMMDQLHLGEMPPADAKRPTSAEQKAVLEQLARALSEGREALASTGGRTVLRRLNRREYLNTVGDLFALNMAAFDPTTNFPRDQAEEQMDNLGDVLRTSGYLLEQYLEAADVVVEKAFALRERPEERAWHFRGDFKTQPEMSNAHRRLNNSFIGLYECMDTPHHEGGYGFISAFEAGVPVDGHYEIQLRVQAMNRTHPYDPRIFGTDAREPFRLGLVPGDARAGALYQPQPLQPMLAELVLDDGEPAWRTVRVWLEAGQTPRFVFPNGPKSARNSWARIIEYHKDKWPKEEAQGERGRDRRNGLGIVLNRIISVGEGKLPHIRIHEVKIRGPLVEQWPPASERAVLGEKPFAPQHLREVLRGFADRAYRRPATDEEVDRLVAVATRRMATGRSPLEGLKAALKAALSSPSFLYLAQDTVPAGDDSPARPRLSGFALASRLSYFLWSTMPDGELLRLAASGDLARPEVLVAQTRRMLASPRADAFVAGFLDSWLNLRSLGSMPPDRRDFEPYYAKGLEQAFKTETRLFMRDLIARDASIVGFLDADHSFLNQALATHYGVGDLGDPARAHEFRRVVFPDSRRGGLLGMGSVLTVSANGIETSPVVRGVFLLENILGTPPPPPPDSVPAIDPDVRGARSIRELVSKHRESPNCYGCHQKIDPLGFALENFDPVGAWRTSYGKKPIDASGELPGGDKFSDVTGLKQVLVKRRDIFARMLADRLLTYACGRRIGVLDEPGVERILAAFPDHQPGLRSLIEAVVTSELFLRP